MSETTLRLLLVGDVDDARGADARAVGADAEPSSPVEYSSTSTRYGLPSIVTGCATCGIVIVGHVRRLISGTCGLGLRCWTWLRSTMIRPSPDGHVAAVAVVGDGHAVRVELVDAERDRDARVRDVHRRRVPGADRRRVEGLAVRRHPALVADEADRGARLAAPGGGSPARGRRRRRCPAPTAGLPATAASSPRLTLMFTDSCGVCIAGVEQRRRCARAWPGRHVEHGDAGRLEAEVQRVRREQQRRVVVGALVARLVDVAQDLEAAGLAAAGRPPRCCSGSPSRPRPRRRRPWPPGPGARAPGSSRGRTRPSGSTGGAVPAPARAPPTPAP